EEVPVNGNGTYDTSEGFVANVPGTWRWVVTYSGDDNNNPVGPLDELVDVAEQGPSLTTTPGPGTTVPLGPEPEPVTLTDTALLDCLNSPATGTLVFMLEFNDGTTTTTVYTNNVTVDGNRIYTTSEGDHPGGFTLPDSGRVTGVYQWNVSYISGDLN